MTRAEQTIHARMMEIREVVRSGATEMVGKTYRGASGKIEGRYRGGMSKAFPELERAGLTPGEAAKAIESKRKGKRFKRLYKAIADEYGLSTRKRGRGRLVVPRHRGNRRCKHCRQLHSTSEHRFHGPGSFNQTHLFSFNPRMKKRSSFQKNPHAVVVIYGRVLAIEAMKTQKHLCDAECKRFGHRYRHDFKPGAVMYGLDDGSILIRGQ